MAAPIPLFSTGLADHLAAGGSLKAALDGGRIRVFSSPGAIPATADDATVGTALWTITQNGDGTGLTVESVAGGRGIKKPVADVWGGPTTAGTPAYWRFEESSDDGSLSTTFKRMQGTAGTLPTDTFLVDTSAPFVTDTALLARTLKQFFFSWPA